MKLFINQLPQHLTKKLFPIYVVSGDESLLVFETVDMIRLAAEQAGFTERIRISTESGDWGNLFYSHATSFSLFATQRLLEIDLTTIKLNAASSKILQEFIAQPPKDTLLLIRAQKLESKSEQSAWYKALDKVGVIIPIWTMSLEQLPNWILQRAAKLNLNFTKKAAEHLSILVEGNLLAAANELEKLRLLTLSDSIDEKTIANIATDNAQFDVFTLVDSVLNGNLERSVRILKNLSAENTEPTFILWALTRELRTMCDLLKNMQQGIQLSALFSQFKIWEKRQSSVRAFLKRYTQEMCWKRLTDAAQIDRYIKGAESGHIWTALEQWIVKLSL